METRRESTDGLTTILQLTPSKAEHLSHFSDKCINDVFKRDVFLQPKYDGERILLHFLNGKTFCTTRRISKSGKFSEVQDKLPIVQTFAKLAPKGYTVIDCECYAKDWSTVVGILHSLPDRAIKLQKETPVRFAAFDVLFYDGIDVREENYENRLRYLRRFIDKNKCPSLHYAGDITADKKYYYISDWMLGVLPLSIPKSVTNDEFIQQTTEYCISQGFEGFVIKPCDKRYGEAGSIIKCKKFETVDLVVCGYKEGSGKYAGTVGAICAGYYSPESGETVTICNVNCGTDEDRDYWNRNRHQLLGSVIEVKFQETTDKSLRHPVLVRRRPDKDGTMCTKNSIFKEKG